jgi:hypothetical protein
MMGRIPPNFYPCASAERQGKTVGETEMGIIYSEFVVDRDMFMRFIGGGIGHRATDYLPQSIPEPAPKMLPDTQEGTPADFDDIETEEPGQHP